jgi:hypothetical protein
MSAHNFNIAANFVCGQSFFPYNVSIFNMLEHAW